MKFVIQWFINFDEASYETLIEYDVDSQMPMMFPFDG